MATTDAQRPLPGATLARPLPDAAVAAREWLAALRLRVLLGTLALGQWLLVAVLALRARHDGWTYDPAHPPTGTAASLLPAIVLAQTLVLLPLALVLVHRLAERLAGRVFAAWTALLWVVLPFAGVAFANRSFRSAGYVDGFLTHAVGLTADSGFAAMLVFLAASVLALRVIERGSWPELAGVVAACAGAVALSPRSATVVLAPLVALGAGGRPRHALAAAAAVGVVFLGLAEAVHADLLNGPFGRVSLDSFSDLTAVLREVFWSGRVLEWLTIGGIVGALRSRRPAGALVAIAAVAAFLSAGGGTDPATRALALLHGMLPAWFAVVAAAASIPLLAPRGRGTHPATETIARWWSRLYEPAFGRAAAPADESRPVATPLWAATALACSFALIAFVGLWNATRYPVLLGYDAAEHIAYADQLIQHGSIPSRSAGGEYYTPPGYYAVAGAATWVGRQLGMAEPHQAAQYVNVLFVLATAALLLALARMLFPRRPVVWVAAVGFFSLVPVVPKTAAMFHPETLNMLLSTAAVTVAVRILKRRDFTVRWLALLGLLLGLGQVVRASSIFTLAGVALALFAALARREHRRRVPWRKLALAVAALAVVVTPWYVRQVVTYHTQPIYVNAPLGHQLFHAPPYPDRPPYLGLALGGIFNTPFRPNYKLEALSETYTEIWGDWMGNYAWSSYNPIPSPDALRVLKNQSLVGVLPTLLAVGGWLALAGLAARRRLPRLPLAPVILVPAVALVGYLWRSYVQLSPDGDVLKASYLLTTAPLWALALGFAVDRLSRYRMLAAGLVLAFAVSAVVDLQFVLYGVRDHRPPF